MLWSLISSAYVIYLYRKLVAERSPVPADQMLETNAIGAELTKLDQQIAALERRLAVTAVEETAP